MKYCEKQNYWKGILFAIIVVLLTWFFIEPNTNNNQNKECFDTGRGLECE
jgi:hypothetical protein